MILVDWIDPHSDGGWKDPHEVDEVFKRDIRCKAVGWLIKEDKSTVMIAASRTADGLGDFFVIPRRCIDEITPLSLCTPGKQAVKPKTKPRAKPSGEYLEMKRG